MPDQHIKSDKTTKPAGRTTSARRSLKEGINAFASVRAAAKRHSTARGQLKKLQERLKADLATLEHRETIARDYASIVSTQKHELELARKSHQAAEEEGKRLSAERTELEKNLSAMKAKHEEALHPYRELMTTAKGRSDDAAKLLADLKRAVKQAETQVADATKRREQQIAAANRAVDNAQDRLRKTQGELADLQAGSGSSSSAIAKVQREAVAEQAHLDAAKLEVTRATAESQKYVDNAQTHLWTQRQSLEVAERRANEAKQEATTHREEYERLHAEASQEEQKLAEQISAITKSATVATREREATQTRIKEAEAALTEAHEIHDTPEATEVLRKSIEDGKNELALLEQEAERLGKNERDLRIKTRKQRFVVAGVALLVVILVIVILYVILGGFGGGATR